MKTEKFLIYFFVFGLLLSLAINFLPALTSAAGPDFSGQVTTFAGDVGYSGTDTLQGRIALIVKALLTLIGIVFLVLIIYGGFQWMTSMGSKDKIDTARKMIVAAAIGLIIVFLAYTISNFVIDALTKTT
ncbi:MAG: hypothetical protein A2Y67_02250 [Candidatus Buchananbacteria bacterium RBG_13_39_9]|uniref:Uncharacterized protein n=1 Tax=Candidatus Buchananbacteria bacterium RBG_13_39_9 TaxID=1797531 RepID=A0A1G1XPJ2_9BACT|nr:MAG: hypothetical protein A2Y67_02250 [Candidatus Buchananbacteria bacterium RBG_13_39_9]